MVINIPIINNSIKQHDNDDNNNNNDNTNRNSSNSKSNSYDFMITGITMLINLQNWSKLMVNSNNYITNYGSDNNNNSNTYNKSNNNMKK